MLNLLIVDDDRFVREACRDAAAALGYHARSSDSAEQALRLIDSQTIDVVLFDLKLSDSARLNLLQQIKHCRPGIEVIMMTCHGTAHSAVQAMKAGAYDYVAFRWLRRRLVQHIVSA